MVVWRKWPVFAGVQLLGIGCWSLRRVVRSRNPILRTYVFVDIFVAEEFGDLLLNFRESCFQFCEFVLSVSHSPFSASFSVFWTKKPVTLENWSPSRGFLATTGASVCIPHLWLSLLACVIYHLPQNFRKACMSLLAWHAQICRWFG